MQTQTNRSKLGVIDSLNAGFVNVNRRPWLIALPLLLDILLWRGPLVTPLPFVQTFMASYTQALSAAGGELADPARLAEMRATIEAGAAGFNMLSLLVLNFVVSVPTLGAGRTEDAFVALPLEGGGEVLLVLVGLELAGMFLGCLYFGLLAQQVRDGQIDLSRLVDRVKGYFLAVVLLALFALGLLVGVGVPLTFVITFAVLFGGPVGAAFASAIVVGLSVAAMWAVLFLYFVVDAIVVSELRARRAILSSVSVVGKNFWQALAFVFLTFVIMAGTQIIWSNMGDSAWATIGGMVGNAYIASGLAAASMCFYLSRQSRTEQHGNT